MIKYSSNWSKYGVYSKIRLIYNVESLFNIKAKRSLWSEIFQLIWQVGKGSFERKKWYWFMTIKSTYFISVRLSLLIRLQSSCTQFYLERLRNRCFSMNFAKFLRNVFLQNNSGFLLLIEAVSSPNPIIK